ncbi:MAG: hypothetical protein IKX00_02250 [Bacilli bacterium]|nr:hypothetical protein [Bacilli bacterium]
MPNYIIEKFKEHCHDIVEGKYEKIEYGQQILTNIVFKNVDKNFANDFSNAELEFVNSDCVCDYVKELMTKCLKADEDFNEEESEAIKLLQSEKTFNKMTADEIEKLVEELGNSRGFYYIPGLYQRYFFTIKGKGVNEYLLTKVDKYDIAREFLQTSGLSTRAEYYAGLGVRYWDLEPNHLKSIYYKFLRLNPEAAVEFYKMVILMKTLGATEFIDTLYRFARNDFKTEGLFIADNNVVSDSATHTGMAIGFFAALGNNQSIDDQVRLSNNMKYSFFSDISDSLSKIAPELFEKHLKEFRKREMNNYYNYDLIIDNSKSNRKPR